jgi:hypothetical protein
LAFFGANHDTYSAGKATKVSSVAVNKPQITTIAKGRCVSEPMSCDKAMGSCPHVTGSLAAAQGAGFGLSIITR